MRLKRSLSLAAGLALLFGLSGSAQAGNVVLTGHDDDFHQSVAANAQVSAMMTFVRNGSTLPVLTFDEGTQLTSQLTALGIPFVNISTPAAVVTASATSASAHALFNPALYSAFAVASPFSCGGCDNSAAMFNALDNANIRAAVTDFFNPSVAAPANGRGIMGLAGAAQANAYAYLPNSASPSGSPPSTPYFQTADGAAVGIPAVNGDPTHNFFATPGTGGVDAAYKVFERLNNATTGTPETIGLAGGTIGGGGFATGVPEPATMAMAATGIVSLLGFGWRRRVAVV